MVAAPKLSILLVVTGICLCSCDHCSTCVSNVCYSCQVWYQLNNGSCFNAGPGTGAIVGIVIGCVVGGTLVVLGLLWIIVYCSNTVEDRVEIVEATTTDAYYLPPSNQTLGATVSTQHISSQVAQGYVNTYGNYPHGQIVTQPQMNVKQIQIQMQPPRQLPALNLNETYRNRDTCTICITSGTNIRLLPCNHQFHVHCLVNWINKKKACPNCNCHSFQALIMCNRCGNFNQSVSFCSTGCQKPSHLECFSQRNRDKLTCRNCARGSPGVTHLTYPSALSRR